MNERLKHDLERAVKAMRKVSGDNDMVIVSSTDPTSIMDLPYGMKFLDCSSRPFVLKELGLGGWRVLKDHGDL